MKTKLLTAAAVVAPFIAICLLGVSRAQTYDWSGAYAGINAGGSWGKASARYPLGAATINGFDPDSFIGGGHLGYGIQSDFIFAGLEADMAWRHGTGKKSLRFRTASISRPTKSSKIGSELFDRVSDSP